MDFQHRIFNLINRDRKGMLASRIYDWYMLVMILGSLVPLMFVRNYPVFTYIEAITVGAFIVDYLMRWYSSPLQLKEGWISYVKYPFTPMAIIDLLTILSGMDLISAEFKILRLTRLLRLVALLKIFRYSSKIAIFVRVLKQEKDVLLGVVGIAVFYIFRLGAYNVQCRAPRPPRDRKCHFRVILRRALLGHRDIDHRRVR